MKARFFCSLFILCTCFVFWVSAQRGLMKRDAGEGKFYVFSSREGCVSVASAEPCPVSWKLNTDVAKMYETQNNAINATLELYLTIGVNEQCRNDLKATLCTQATPRCFEDGGRDYGDAKKTCEKLYGSCPEAYAEAFKKNKFCDSLMTGKHPKGDCVSPPRLIKGDCPQPKHKMTLRQFTAYEKQSQKYVATFKTIETTTYSDGTRIYSSECASNMEEMLCAPLYCSADEKSLLTKYDQADCNNLVKSCFNGVLTKLSSPTLSKLVNRQNQLFKAACNSYPEANTTETQPAPPTVVVGQPTVVVGQPTVVVGQPTVVVGQPTVVVGQPTVVVGQPTATVDVGRPPAVVGKKQQPSSLANSHLPQLVLLLLFVCFSIMFSVYDEN